MQHGCMTGNRPQQVCGVVLTCYAQPPEATQLRELPA